MTTLHFVSHTHWDREWYMPFQAFRLKLVHLVDHLLQILENDPTYQHFMLDGQAIVLEDYLLMRPERAADLRHYIQAGRILIGPWYILPDEFLVSPEATIRNLIEGDQITRDFGPKMRVGYLPDTFGHIGQMPQILLGFGIDTASVWRGMGDVPCEFRWQSADGSQVLAANLRESYSNAAGILGGRNEAFVEQARSLRDTLKPHAAASHLLLMNGTDHMEPSAATPEAIAFTVGKLDGDRLLHSTLPAYLEGVRASVSFDELPVVVGELRGSKRSPLLPGVLSTRMWIKQRNRACETLLEKWAGPFSAWAEVAGPQPVLPAVIQHPASILRQAWRLLMACHPHDSICGCSIDQVHNEMRPRFDQVDQIGEEITRQSLETLAAMIDTQPGPGLSGPIGTVGSALVVFNPTTVTRTDLVIGVLEGVEYGKDYDLVGAGGQSVPLQAAGVSSEEIINMVLNPQEFRMGVSMVSEGRVSSFKIRAMDLRREGSSVIINWVLSEKGEPDLAVFERGMRQVEDLINDPTVSDYRVIGRSPASAQVKFAAPNVPGHGFRSFCVRVKDSTSSALAASASAEAVAAHAEPVLVPDTIENSFFSVTAMPDGSLDVLDKRTGILYHGQNRLVDGGDRGDEYNYSAPPTDPLISAGLDSVLVERSEVQQTLVLNLRLDIPVELAGDRQARGTQRVSLPVTSRISLTAGVPRIDVQTSLDNQARDHRLRVHFSAPFAVSTAAYDGHFEVVQRPLGRPAFDASWVEQPRPEQPQRAFTAVSDGQNGLLIANRGLPEVEVLPGVDGHAAIAVTLLRCVGWLSRGDIPERNGHAGPGAPTPGAQMAGPWTFDYSIVPFEETQRLAAYEQAYAFETPLRAASAGFHPGPLPSEGALIQVEPAGFTLSTVKKAEDGSGWVVRGYNLTGQDMLVRMMPGLAYQAAQVVNLAEEKLADLAPEANGAITCPVRGHQILTVLFR